MSPRDKVINAIGRIRIADEVLNNRLMVELQTGFGPRAADHLDTVRVELRLAIQYLDSLEGQCPSPTRL